MANLVLNPSFEADTASWSLDADYVRSTADSHDGSASVKQVSTTNFANFTTVNDATGIAVQQKKMYTLSFWAKVTVTSGSAPIYQINVGSAFGTTIASANLVDTAAAWQQFFLNFNTGSNPKVWIRIFNNNGSVTVYYDDFQIQEFYGGESIAQYRAVGVGNGMSRSEGAT